MQLREQRNNNGHDMEDNLIGVAMIILFVIVVPLSVGTAFATLLLRYWLRGTLVDPVRIIWMLFLAFFFSLFIGTWLRTTESLLWMPGVLLVWILFCWLYKRVWWEGLVLAVVSFGACVICAFGAVNYLLPW